MREEHDVHLIKFLNNYKIIKGLKHDTWLIDCASTIDIESCITMAATSTNCDGKRHPHQYRIRKKSIEEFLENLLGEKNSMLASKNFDDLYKVIYRNKTKGIGLLTIYDTALRIGGKLQLHPNKVYLHRGAKKGAEKLLNRKIKVSYLDKEEFGVLSDFTCAEIEDILCHYSKGELEINDCLPLKQRTSNG